MSMAYTSQYSPPGSAGFCSLRLNWRRRIVETVRLCIYKIGVNSLAEKNRASQDMRTLLQQSTCTHKTYFVFESSV